MASLIMGTSFNMNMFSNAMADGKDRDDKRYHYNDNDNNKYLQSTYDQDPFSSSYNMEYSYDASNNYGSNRYEMAYMTKEDMTNSYDKNSYKIINDTYSKYPTKDKKYACRTGPLEGFFVSSVEFYKLKIPSSLPCSAGPQGAASTIQGEKVLQAHKVNME